MSRVLRQNQQPSTLAHPSPLSPLKLTKFFKQTFGILSKEYLQMISNQQQVIMKKFVEVPQLPQYQIVAIFKYKYGKKFEISAHLLKNHQFFRFKNIHQARRVMSFINITSLNIRKGAFFVHPQKLTFSYSFGSTIEEYLFSSPNRLLGHLRSEMAQGIAMMIEHLYMVLYKGGEMSLSHISTIQTKGIHTLSLQSEYSKVRELQKLRNQLVIRMDEQSVPEFKMQKYCYCQPDNSGQDIIYFTKTQQTQTNKNNLPQKNVSQIPKKPSLDAFGVHLKQTPYIRPTQTILGPEKTRERLENFVHVQFQVKKETDWTVFSEQSQSRLFKSNCKFKEIVGQNNYQLKNNCVFTKQPITRLIAKKEYQGQSGPGRARRERNIIKRMGKYSSNFIPKYYHPAGDDMETDRSIYMSFYKERSATKYFTVMISNDTKLKFLKSAIQGLRFLRDIDIIHKDIKLENILISKDLGVKITDYGESIVVKQSSGQEKRNQRFSLPYVAPEIDKEESQITSSFDTYGFGVMIHYLLTQRFILPFWHGHDQKHLLNMIIKGTYPQHLLWSVEMYTEMLPPEIAQLLIIIILKSLDPNPKRRPNQDFISILLNRIEYSGQQFQ